MKIKLVMRDECTGRIDWYGTILVYFIILLVMLLFYASYMTIQAQHEREEFIKNVPAGYHVEYVPHEYLMPYLVGKTTILVPYTEWRPIYVKDREPETKPQ